VVTPLADGPVRLKVVAHPASYDLYAQDKLIGSFAAELLSRPKAPLEWMFTGTRFGLFAKGA
jgi:hypothetical protein